VLTAAWNASQVDFESVARATRTLEGMGLLTARDRLSKLRDLET
jgi:hypothetical protein